jgi:hypothetical protein
VLIREPLHAFQLHNERLFNKEIREVFTNAVALVHHRNRSLSVSPNAAQCELAQESPLINLFKEPEPQRVGDFKHRAKHALRQCVVVISVHQRLSAANIMCSPPPTSLKIIRPLMNADER